jgi:hypothetical protein
MGLYFLRLITFSYHFSKYLWLTYIFIFFVRKLKVLFLSFYRYLFRSSSLLPVFFFFERLIDLFYMCFLNLQLMEGFLSRVFVFKFFVIRFFFFGIPVFICKVFYVPFFNSSETSFFFTT